MGNVKGWGGPLPKPYWYQRQLALQHKIIQRMRSFGMIPVLPAFAGHVPKALARVFPHATMTTLSRWSHFSPPYVPTYLLDPNDELFKVRFHRLTGMMTELCFGMCLKKMELPNLFMHIELVGCINSTIF